MRKRIILGLLAVVVIGVVAFFLSQPRKGSVEYHKREYIKAYEHSTLERWFGEGNVPLLQQTYWRRRHKQIEFHRQALLESGYLREQEFVVSNRVPRDVASAMWGVLHFVFTNDSDNTLGFTTVLPTHTNTLSVTAPAEAMGKLRELIGEADVPEGGK